MAEDNKVLKDGQFRKNAFIAFFNAENNATERAKAEGPVYKGKGKGKKLIPFEERCDYWADRTLKRYQNYCAKVIAAIGTNYNLTDALNKLKKIQSKEDLKSVWFAFSEDERRDPQIKQVVKEIKEKLKNGTN